MHDYCAQFMAALSTVDRSGNDYFSAGRKRGQLTHIRVSA
jgi:hypothetical protein